MPEAMTTDATPVLVLTALAIDHLRSALDAEAPDGDGFVRFGVSEGGCSGLSYAMKIDRVPHETDVVWQQGDLPIRVDVDAVPHLSGVTVDYVTSLTASGFRFVNPNAERTCGCGTSFA